MTISETFDKIVKEADTAEPDQTKRIDSHTMRVGFLVSTIVILSQSQHIEIMKFMVERDMISLDDVNHVFVVS